MSVSSPRAVSISTGTGPVALHAAADLEAVDPGEHEIEDHEVGPQAVAQLNAGDAVVGHLDVEAFGPQPGGHGRRDHGLVLDHADERYRHERRVCHGDMGAMHCSRAGSEQNHQRCGYG